MGAADGLPLSPRADRLPPCTQYFLPPPMPRPASPRAVGRPRRSSAQEVEARETLLAAARSLFAREGYESVSIRKITAQAGISPMSFYLYFPSKRALLWHIIIDVFETNLANCDVAMAKVSGAQEKLRVFGYNFVGYWRDNVEHFRVAYLNEATETTSERSTYIESAQLILSKVENLGDLFSRGTAEGIFPPHDSVARGQAYFAMLSGIALSLITIPEYPWADPELVVRDAIETFLRGAAHPA